MVEEIKDNEEDPLYKEMSTQTTEKEVDLPDDGGRKTLSEKTEEAPTLTDMQTALRLLFPEDLGDYVTNRLMVGRIDPAAFLPLLHLLVKGEIAEADPTQKISVEKMMARHYILLSKGLDGKGIIDILELAGAQAEKEEMEKLGKSLGMG